MRITYYARVTPALLAQRGKDVFRSINCLRNYISQSNRQGQMQLVFTKTEDTMTEIFASLRGTTFNQQLDEKDEYDIDSEEEEESEAPLV